MTKKTAIQKHVFPENWKTGVYRAIYARRDIRSQFKSDPIPEDTLARILKAAHHAPSVGFMQPWDFIVIRSVEIRKRIKEAFHQANQEAAMKFDERKRGAYQKFKLEGILESPLNLCITCDRARFGPVVIGRTCQPIMDLYSSVCAVQNFWLAARAEGIGVGWVSIIHPKALKDILKLPQRVEPVAYLCVGTVSEFPEKPELESAGWLQRVPLSEVIHTETWDRPIGGWKSLEKALSET